MSQRVNVNFMKNINYLIDMKKLITALSILIFLGFVVGGYLLGKHTSSILDFGEGLFIWLTILCASIWFGRKNKDSIYRLFKDIHQSNLDDIERQQLEEQKQDSY
jgi:hypothetical protein